MTVTAPEAGTCPVWIRCAAGPLGGAEDVTRSMGLTTNGSRLVVSCPLTGSWESWASASATVALDQGPGRRARRRPVVPGRGAGRSRIHVLLNGTVVNAVDRTVPLGGYIGLENRSEAAQVDFPDVQVQPGVDLGPIAGPAKRATTADGTTRHPTPSQG